ncbi:MAG TPA: cytochrome c oxidase subunit II [Gemmatimonadaceae bacterium]|nr:cytochrome c oxidase subunit II [Gemmatimonadaceae bacterium]
MHYQSRPRRLVRAALTVALAASSLVVAACTQYPNSVFHSRTDTNRDIGFLFEILIWFGSIVFVVVEAILVYTLIRFRRRGATRQPEHVHGNTTLEITWTIIPAVILVFIAIPTVRTIFRTQAKASSSSLEVEVIGHQWWWEFRYPQYTTRSPTGKLDTVVTANELYLPQGRMVNFALKTVDVIHSFWVPALSGKRDLIANHTNYLWFTPDSATLTAYNGFCVEFCGASHANMRFRTFVVTPDEFASWIGHQQTPAAFAVATPAPAVSSNAPAAAPRPAAGAAAAPAPAVPAPAPSATAVTPVAQAGFIAFPRDRMPKYTVPTTPTPSDVLWTPIFGDPGRGAELLMKGAGACLGCHTIRGNPSMIGQIGPNLTHIGSRTTIAAGLYPNDARHLALWIKNARKMKPGVLMPTIGLNEYDPQLGATMKAGLTDQQIADIVAYLQALK